MIANILRPILMKISDGDFPRPVKLGLRAEKA